MHGYRAVGRKLRGALVLEDKVLDSFGLFQFRAIRSEQLR